MDLFFNSIIRRKILFYAAEENSSGHWGNSEVEIPEYAILIKKIKEEQGQSIQLTERQLLTILDWFNTATSEGTTIDQEDAFVLQKIRTAIQTQINQSQKEIHTLQKRLDEIDILLPQNREK